MYSQVTVFLTKIIIEGVKAIPVQLKIGIFSCTKHEFVVI